MVDKDVDVFINNDRYKPILEALIDTFPELSHIDVETIVTISNIKTDNRDKKAKMVYADITKVSDKLLNINRLYYSGNKHYKYILQIYENHTEDLTNNQLVAVIYHELLHINSEGNLRGHDFEDFYAVIDKTKNTRWTTVEIDSILPEDITEKINEHLDNSRNF